MKNQINVLGKVIDCEYKELFRLQGIERYEAIKKLPIVAPSLICSFYKHCDKCPLFLSGNGKRSYCADFAFDSTILKAIENGAEFVTLEDLKNEENV